MAIRFARQPGNWSDPLTWDGGLTIPTTGDDVYFNSFAVIIDQNINVNNILNYSTIAGVPLSPIPNMTSDNTPSGVGIAFSSSFVVGGEPWRAYSKEPTTNLAASGYKSSASIPNQFLGYQFNVAKNIQRYSWFSNSWSPRRPKDWTFEGSNDNVSWSVLHTVSGYTTEKYFSPVISNPSSYTYYRINVSNTQGNGGQIYIDKFDMTESTDLIDGYNFGGYGTITNSVDIQSNLIGANQGHSGTNPALGNGFIILCNTDGLTINIISNVTVIGFTAFVGGLYFSGNSTYNVTGNLHMNSSRDFYSVIRCLRGTLNVVGNTTRDFTPYRAFVIYLDNPSGLLNFTGVVDHEIGTFSPSIDSASSINNLVNIVGTVYNSTTATAAAIGTPPTFLSGDMISRNGITPIMNLRINSSATTTYTTLSETVGLTTTLYTPGVATGHPAEANVRTGVVYGPTNNLTGTCAVPPAAAVGVGVPVDNTVGTGYLNATDIWNMPLASITTPNSIGERLKDASTVQTTGAQLAAFL